MIVRRQLAIALLLHGVAAAAVAQQNRFALIVQRASGDPEYATLHRGWVDAMVKLLRDQFKMDPRALIVLTEKPGAGEERSSAEAVRAAFARLAKESKPSDLVFVMLIGHGSGDAVSAKFNLIGPDLTTEEWAAIVKPVPARIAFVNTTSASFPFLAGLSGVNRVVITATNSVAQRYHTHFPGAFIQSLAASDADTDKNGRISLLEAFTHASRLVTQQFEQNFRESTEKALLDDNGDGKGRLRSEEHTSELQSRLHLVCRLLLEKKKTRLPGIDYQPQRVSLLAGALRPLRQRRLGVGLRGLQQHAPAPPEDLEQEHPVGGTQLLV